MQAARVAMARGAAMLLCGAVLAAGCGGGANGAAAGSGEAAIPALTGGGGGDANPTPRTWSVAIGESGGFTGGSRGYVIAATGEVREWSQITPDDTTTTLVLGTASPAILSELEDAMRVVLQSPPSQETGNLTRSLEWRDVPRVVRWTWADRGPQSLPPQSLQRAVAAAEAAVASARNVREER